MAYNRTVIYPAKMEAPFQPAAAETVTSDKWGPEIADVIRPKVRIVPPNGSGVLNTIQQDTTWTHLPLKEPFLPPPPRQQGLQVTDAKQLTQLEVITSDRFPPTPYQRPYTLPPRLDAYPLVTEPALPVFRETDTPDKWDMRRNDIFRRPVRWGGFEVIDAKQLTLPQVVPALILPVAINVTRRPAVHSPLWTRTPALIEMSPFDWTTFMQPAPPPRKRAAVYPPFTIAPFQPAPAETITPDKWNPEIADVMRAKFSLFQQGQTYIDPQVLTLTAGIDLFRWFRDTERPRWNAPRPVGVGWQVTDPYLMTQTERVYIAAFNHMDYLRPRIKSLQPLWSRTPAFIEVFPIDWFTKLGTPIWGRKPVRTDNIFTALSTGGEQPFIDKFAPSYADILRPPKRVAHFLSVRDLSDFPTLPHTVWYRPLSTPRWEVKRPVREGLAVTDYQATTAQEFPAPEKWTQKYADILRPRKQTSLGLETIDPSLFPEHLKMDWYRELSRTIPELEPLVNEGWVVIDAQQLADEEPVTVDRWKGNRPDYIWKTKPLVPTGWSVMDNAPAARLEITMDRWYKPMEIPVWNEKLLGWQYVGTQSILLLTFQLPWLGMTTTRLVIWSKTTKLRNDADDE